MSFDLSIALDREELAAHIKRQIDIVSRETLAQKPRTHLGMSEVGERCKRKIWGKFRWLAFEEHDGKTLRLFRRGHEEEPKVIAWLEKVGMKLSRFNYTHSLWYHPESNSYIEIDINEKDHPPHFGMELVEVTGDIEHEKRALELGQRQNPPQRFIVSGVGGHYGGETDGKASFPEMEVKQEMLFECKTANDSNFKALRKKGIIKHYPKHYAQMSAYGAKYGIDYAIYAINNKNDDDIEIQILKLDHKYAKQLEQKAEKIIRADKVPAAISLDPAHNECKYCHLSGQCHGNELPVKNCRSCRMCEPWPDKQWYCHQWNLLVPKHEIPNGCEAWNPWRMNG